MSYQCLTHRFVDSVPERLEPGVVYVSIEFTTVIHLCCCGCGKEVVTPLSSSDWKLTFDGESISLHPSIGNWNFSCRSHYWIRKNRPVWAADWTEEEVAEARLLDIRGEDNHPQSSRNLDGEKLLHSKVSMNKRRCFWAKILRWFR